MSSFAGRLVRAAYRREVIPDRVRWWLAAAGMIDFGRVLARDLRAHMERDSRAVVAGLFARTFERRWSALRSAGSGWPDDQATRALVFGGLYRMGAAHKSAWIFSATGGAPRGISGRLRAGSLLRALSPRERWEEVTVHLGEVLIVATEDLPAHVARVSKVLGDICFAMGARYAERTKKLFGLRDEAISPDQAIEVLRMSEYVFRVNPEHWSEQDLSTGTGSIEGTACPWYTRPGWNAGHCGIFGQFQAGISSIFGLKYRLAETIPKHGGTTCKIDLVPLPSKRRSLG